MSALLEVATTKAVEFVTSRYAERELEKMPEDDDERRTLALVLVRLLPRVAAHQTQFSGVQFRTPAGQPVFGIGFGYEVIAPRQKQLREIFDRMDADHIHEAAEARCDVFLTDDDKTILKRVRRDRQAVEELCPGLAFLTVNELRQRLQAGPRRDQ